MNAAKSKRFSFITFGKEIFITNRCFTTTIQISDIVLINNRDYERISRYSLRIELNVKITEA